MRGKVDLSFFFPPSPPDYILWLSIRLPERTRAETQLLGKLSIGHLASFCSLAGNLQEITVS